MLPEVGPKPSPEKPLGYLLPLLSGYHLHYGEGKLQRPRLRFPLGKRPNRDSVPIWEWIGNRFKFLSINAYSLGFRVAHFLQLITNFVQFD
jgi:hypothetical protein